MPTLTLTARAVASLSASGRRVEYFDTEVAGLVLRVTADGVKTWSLIYRYCGRRRRLTIGRYPDLSLADARRTAEKARGQVAAGNDPAADKKAERATYGDTIGALFDFYSIKANKKRTWSEESRIFEHDVLPAWRHRRVRDLQRRDVRELVERKAVTAPVMANRILAHVSCMLNFALEHDWIEANPAARIPPPGDEISRDRVLTRVELRELWPALHEIEAVSADGKPLPRLVPALNDAMLAMLLTAQRCGEVCRMRWNDVDLEGGWWTIPGSGTKNGDVHRVPLTAPVLQILKTRQDNDRDERFVFSTRARTCVAARAKKAASRLSRGLSFAFRAHDLRRTAASCMGEAGVDRLHIAYVLNHRSVTHNTMTAIYDRYRYDKEKRVALETWARVLLDMLRQPATPPL